MKHRVESEDVLNLLSIGVIRIDSAGTVVFLNPTAAVFFQVAPGAVIGKRVDMLPLRSPLYRMLSEDLTETALDITVGDLVLEVTCCRFAEPGGVGELYEIRDVTTDRKRSRDNEESVAMMTHDLRAPLTVITGYLDILKSEIGSGSEAVAAGIAALYKSTRKITSMIDDVLDVYRLDAGVVEVAKAQCDIYGVIDKCCRDGAREAVARGIQFSSGVCRNMVYFDGDDEQMARVFSNLIGNAIKFTPRGGVVCVCSWIEEGQLAVEIGDTGIGIPPEETNRIFQKYYRSSSAQGFKGTGLGLTITKAIVEAHGGTIHVESTLGKGTSFTVRLPVRHRRNINDIKT